MLIDRPQITETSFIVNPTVPSGAADPLNPSTGELFYRTDLGAMRVYGGTVWNEAGAGGLSTHTGDATLHLTPAQNTLLDGLNLPSLTSAHLNFLTGLTVNVQGKFNTLDSTNSTQDGRLTAVENQSSASVSGLSTHTADQTLHLTSAQNTLLDGLAATLTSAELNFVDGVTSSIQAQFTNVDAIKFDKAGGTITGPVSISGQVTASGGITGLPAPVSDTDAANKGYVDLRVSGLSWKAAVQCATVSNISLSGLQTIDGYALANSERVLVKNQSVQTQNGIYQASTSAWSRAADANSADALDSAAIFVRSGTAQADTAWVQTSSPVVIGSTNIVFQQFGALGIGTTAGAGISVSGNQVSVNNGNGLTFSSGQLVPNLSPRLVINGAAIDLQTLVTAGSVGSSSSIPQISFDQFGRITATAGLAINTSNITEGSNLFYTDARARASISVVGAGLSYNSGVITLISSSSNVANTVAYRDAGGNFNANAITANAFIGSLTGTASNNVIRAGDTMTGALRVGTGVGHTAIIVGNATNPGTLEFFTADNTRRGYIGSNNGSSNLMIESESGWNWAFNQAPLMAGSIAWHQGNLTNLNQLTNGPGYITSSALSGYALLSGASFNGDITVSRSAAPTTGMIYLGQNSGTRFLFYDGTQYALNGAELYVNSQLTLTAGTYNSYAPTLTGGGASGTWNINITGSAAQVGGYSPSVGSAANTLVLRDSSGYTYASYNNQSSTNDENPTVNQVMVTNGSDNFMRKAGIGHLTASLTGTAGINITGSSSSATNAVNVSITNDTTTNATHYVSFVAGTGGNQPMRVSSSRLTFNPSTGDLTAGGNVTAYSDSRLKTNVKQIDFALAKVELLKGVTFDRVDTGQSGTGLIAQNVQEVLPEAVHTDENGMLSVAYGNLVGLLIEAIKDLNSQVQDLRAQLHSKD